MQMYEFEKTDKGLLGDQIENRLLEYIQKEPLEIGAKLPNEFVLAEKFGVGRSTIREAVKGLVFKGILEVRRGSGTYVVSTCLPQNDPLGLAKLRDKYKLALELFDVRLMLEPEIVSMAAENAEEEDLKQLKRLCDETEQMYLSGQDHIPKDIEFHTYIARCSKNRVVEMLVPIINTAVVTFADLTRYLLKDETISTHRAIVDAVTARDPMGARCAMVMHLTYNRQEIIRQMREHSGAHSGADSKT